MILAFDFLVFLFAAGIGLVVYRRLIRSPKFSRIVDDVVNPPNDSDAIAELEAAEAEADRQIAENETKAVDAMKAAARISKKRNKS